MEMSSDDSYHYVYKIFNTSWGNSRERTQYPKKVSVKMSLVDHYHHVYKISRYHEITRVSESGGQYPKRVLMKMSSDDNYHHVYQVFNTWSRLTHITHSYQIHIITFSFHFVHSTYQKSLIYLIYIYTKSDNSNGRSISE